MAESARPDLLYLVHRVPYPPDKGDRIRNFHLLKCLSRQANLDLACLADEPVPGEAVAVLQRYCRRLAVVPLERWTRWARALLALARGGTVTEGAFSSPALRGLLPSWVRETRYHACLASASSMVPYLQMKELRDLPAVIDLVDVDSQKWLDYAASSRLPRSWLYRLEGRRLRRLEQTLPSWARAVTLVTEAETDLYRQFCEPGPVHAVGNGVDLDYFQPQPQPAEQGLAFVGVLDYRPNVDGIGWFCREVWPRVRQARPQASLSLIGRRPVPAIQALAQLPGVELVGQVPDVRPYLARAAVAIAPLQIARGVQNKVLEALAMGKAVVASPQCLTGLEAQPSTHLLAASTPQEWLDAILCLLDDADRRRQLGAAGRRFVEENHHWDHCLEPFNALLGLDGHLPSAVKPPSVNGIALPSEAAERNRR